MVVSTPFIIREAVKPAYWSQEKFTGELRRIIYGLWNGVFNLGEFVDSFSNALFVGLSSAWFLGARSMGIEHDEMTDAENQALQVALFQQWNYVPGLANFVFNNSRANDKPLSTAMSRLNLWASRYREFFTRGQLMAKKDQKQVWRLGATDKHCPSCVKLDGKVKRSSQWVAAGIWPKCPGLACGGYSCGCTLTPTSLPMSKGRLPKLP